MAEAKTYGYARSYALQLLVDPDEHNPKPRIVSDTWDRNVTVAPGRGCATRVKCMDSRRVTRRQKSASLGMAGGSCRPTGICQPQMLTAPILRCDSHCSTGIRQYLPLSVFPLVSVR